MVQLTVFETLASLEGQNFGFWGSLGVTAPKWEKQRPGPICTIVQNFTPIGVTVAEMSVLEQ